MHFAYSRLKILIPGFNRRSFRREDIKELVFSRGAYLIEDRFKKPGYYATDGTDDFIFIDNRLRGFNYYDALFHEVTHFLLHYPCFFLHSKHQYEAELLAVLFMIPRRKLFEYFYTPFELIDSRLVPFLIRRQRFYELYKK